MPRIFVSYRRKSWPFTHRLADELGQRLDAEIFVDFSGIDETDFEHAILRNLRESDAVLLVVSEHTFADRIHRDDDWVRREIREALALDKPLILVCVDGLLPPSGLPDDIKDVARRQGINFYPEYFTSAVERLAEFIVKVGAARPRTVPPLESAPKATIPPPSARAALPAQPAQVDIKDLLPPPFEWIEIPPGQVTLEDGHGEFKVPAFFIAKYPVTNAQYQVFVEANNGYQDLRWWDYSPKAKSWREQNPQPAPGMFAGDQRPRETVAWYDAVAFCRWLSVFTGLDVRLPTEQQWQWAAQGRDGRQYPWGEKFDKEKCNTEVSGIKQTTNVDRYSQGASPFGVMDMSGNVFEWCLNNHDDPVDTRLTGRVRRVFRGGCWSGRLDFARAAYRLRAYSDSRLDYVGFRVVRVPQL